MPADTADNKQQIQQIKCDFPYHYIPRVDDGHFSQLQYWSWGIHYPGGMPVILDQLKLWTFDSLVKVLW